MKTANYIYCPTGPPRSSPAVAAGGFRLSEKVRLWTPPQPFAGGGSSLSRSVGKGDALPCSGSDFPKRWKIKWIPAHRLLSSVVNRPNR